MAEHYYSKEQSSNIKLTKINVVLRGFDISFFSSTGVFAAKKLDRGSKLLIEKMVIGERDNILDLGCGNGVIGLIASKLTSGKVVLTDVNPRACKVAKLNTKRLKNVKVRCGDMYEKVEGLKFDVILLNPPQTAGKKVCFRMIEMAKDYLKDGGSLQMVARHRKGGKTLSLKMEEVFGNMEAIAKQGGFRVYISRNSGK